MVKKAKVTIVKKASKKIVEEEENEGLSLDDAFADDEDVEYGESKPSKIKKKDEEDEEDEEEEVSSASFDEEIGVKRNIKASKPVSKIKKGDKIRVDGKEFEVDSHYVLMDHGSTKEMAIELFDAKTDKDYQLRYFDDQMETTMDFYELQEIIYVKRKYSKIEW